MKKMLLVGVVAAFVLSSNPLAQDATAVIDAVARATGAATLQSIQYSGTGAIFLLGQAASPGGPWPRFRLTKYIASVNYSAPMMREEIVRVDDERPPRGGGAGPFTPATGQGGIRPIPGDVVQTQTRDGRTELGQLQIWMTPHGFLRGAAANKATVASAINRGRRLRTISFTAFGKYTVSGIVNDQDLIERVETHIANNMLGDMPVESTFSDYRDFAGVKFPTRIVQRQGGHSTLELTVNDVQPNSPAAQQIAGNAQRGAGAGAARGGAPPAANATVTPEKLADGVWFMSGGNPNSLLVEFADHLVVIEAPQGDEYTLGVIAAARKLAPAKPIRYVVNTHHHFDHAGGVRAYVAEGVTIVTHESMKPYYDRILRTPFRLNPDRLARASRDPMLETVADRRVLSDATRTLELHHVRGNLHSEGLLMAYLPRERLLVQADAFHPRPGAAPLPAPSPYTVNLVENIRRLKLDVAQVAHIHGGLDPYAALLKAAGGT
jgi:glyoxylase-like metal-dependent hydrolase (beta-lactamase superfamily II)